MENRDDLNLLSLALCCVAVIVITVMLIFAAVPSIFFGFQSSHHGGVTRMTRLASSVGTVCVSLNEFERTVIDAIVTSIAAEYEEQGVAIDRIEVESRFDEESLQWFTVINSAAHAQNLEELSIDEIRELCAARLSYSHSLLGEDTVTLRVEIDKLDPDEWMEKLGFTDDARIWAGALFEVYSESDAMNRYGTKFAAADYSGDSGYSGEAEHGHSYGNDIDTSQFIDLGTKTPTTSPLTRCRRGRTTGAMSGVRLATF